MKTEAERFCRKKLTITLWIMFVGMAAGIVWAAIADYLQWGYPSNSIFFRGEMRFNDLSDMKLIALQANPYLDPTAFYLPAFWLFCRWTAPVPLDVQLIALFFSVFGLLYVLINRLFAKVVPDARSRALQTFLLMLTFYPLMSCFDRGNVEIILVGLICAAFALSSRAQYGAISACLAAALCVKFTSALMLVLLVRQRRWGLAILVFAAAILLAWLGLVLLGCPVDESLRLYARNLQYYHYANVYENRSLEGAASPWNAIKLVTLMGVHWGWIRPFDFSYDNLSIQRAYATYAFFATSLTAGMVVYACLLEKRFFRAVIPLLLLTSISAPGGGDHRLVYAGVALALLIATPDLRRFDLAALILLALVIIPKREVIFEFAGKTESGYADVSLQVLLNPLFVLLALALLLAGSWKHLDLRWSRLRLVNLVRALRHPFA